MTTKISGQLEIDYERGVIYFHTSNKRVMKKLGTVTPLRISRLPKPIPKDKPLDIIGFVCSSENKLVNLNEWD
jgi:hypothetical protein